MTRSALAVRALAAPGCLIVAIAAGGCSFQSSSGDVTVHGTKVEFGDFDAASSGLASRDVSRTFTAAGAGPVRIMNVVGTVTIAAGTGSDVEVHGTVYGDGAQPQSVQWVVHRDSSGRAWHYLQTPEQPVRYPGLESGHITLDIMGLPQRTVTANDAHDALFADLVVHVPSNVPVHVRNLVGAVRGGSAAGDLGVEVCVGSITLDSFDGILRADSHTGSITLRGIRGDLHADSGSGDVLVKAFEGVAHLDTGSGDITVNGLDARSLTADTGSGDIALRDGVAANIRADTGSGDITLVNVSWESFIGDTGSGDIRITGELAHDGRLRADTGSGSVTIHGGPDASFSLHTDTGSGNVQVAYADAELVYDDNAIVGARRGEGGLEMLVDTGSGNIHVGP